MTETSGDLASQVEELTLGASRHEPRPEQKLSLLQYYEEGDFGKLQDHIKRSIASKSLENRELIELARAGKEAAALAKEALVQGHKIDETELADRIAREIIGDIETYVDLHLEKYQGKFTLNAPQLTSSVDGSKAKFFNLISLLRDVSILGRKLLEISPRFFDSSRPRGGPQTTITPPVSPLPRPQTPPAGPSAAQQENRQPEKRWLGVGSGGQHRGDTKSQVSDEDATSDDLLAALIESSSTDDFLVLSSSLDSISLREMMVAALVIMTSHECFTLSHDIQGVVMVLRRAKFLIKNILAPKNQMELVTRLLTAIGRYNEMAYVFDLFRDRNQFEILLSKGVEKTPGLRIALYNYAKKNPEYYALVTLNFSMFREIAESLETSALKRLERLVQQSKAKRAKAARKKVSLIMGGGGGGGGSGTGTGTGTGNGMPTGQNLDSAGLSELELATSATNGAPSSNAAKSNSMRKSSSFASSLTGLGAVSGAASAASVAAQAAADQEAVGASGKPLYSRDALNLCLVELVDASDCFARAGCYKRSNDCANRAKLAALQLALLAADVSVLDLGPAELQDTIVSLEHFADAYIVAQAYDHHLAWRQALFRNVILRGQTRYLDEFCNHYELSEALVMELVVLFRQYLANERPSQEEQARLGASMRHILARLKRVALKCQLYTEFNFVESRNELLANPSVCAYLKDLKLA